MKKSLVTVRAAIVCLSLSTAGCGGGGGGGFNVGGPTGCGTAAPCGGDVVGTWNVTVGCITAAGLKDAQSTSICPGETVTITNLTESGTLTFNADMTYSFVALTEQAALQLVEPASCAPGDSCDAANSVFETSTAFASGACSGYTTCTCSAVQAPVVDSESGTYTITGTTLQTTASDGSVSVLPYCVRGTYLHVFATANMSMGAMGVATVEEDTVAQRQ